MTRPFVIRFVRTASILGSGQVHPLVSRVVSNAEVVLELLTELIQGRLSLLGGGRLQLDGILRRALLSDLRHLNFHFMLYDSLSYERTDLFVSRPQ